MKQNLLMILSIVLVFCIMTGCSGKVQSETRLPNPNDLVSALTLGKAALELPAEKGAVGEITELCRTNVYARTLMTKYAWCKQQTVLHWDFTYAEDFGRDIGQVKQETRRLAEEIAASVLCEDLTDGERALLLHDTLCNRCTYDVLAKPQSRWGYGALSTGMAVCEGYAEAYAMLLEAADIPYHLVSGYALPDMQPHLWNLVQIDGQWHHVDVTWDDTDETIAYSYFMLSDAQFGGTHRWNQADYPAAKGFLSVADIEEKLRTHFLQGYSNIT